MQTPRGYTLVDGRFEPVDWLAIIFSPSLPYRLLHIVPAFYITTGLVVMGVGAWLIRRRRATEDARMMVRMALDLLIILVPLQMFLGDQHGLNTREYQPAKLAAIEGLYNTARPAPSTLFGIPDDDVEVMRHAIEIPDVGSFILTHSWNGAVKGLKEWPLEQRPPVGPPFFAFRVMAFIMLFVVVAGQLLRLRGRLWDSVWFLQLCQWIEPLGFIAVVASWTTTETGRQPGLCMGWCAPGFGVALPHRNGRGFVACFLHRRVSDYVPVRHCVHGGASAPRPAAADIGPHSPLWSRGQVDRAVVDTDTEIAQAVVAGAWPQFLSPRSS
jgi:cytochrome d ubiquinol oxidase subunit I